VEKTEDKTKKTSQCSLNDKPHHHQYALATKSQTNRRTSPSRFVAELNKCALEKLSTDKDKKYINFLGRGQLCTLYRVSITFVYVKAKAKQSKAV